jgi:hypothetical protein
MKRNEYIVCKGDGTLWINPSTGDVIWANVCSPMDTWCAQNEYKKVEYLEGYLGLDSKTVPLPPCGECPDFQKCCNYLDDDDIFELDSTECTAIDTGATAAAILSALAALSPDIRSDILRIAYGY